MGQIIGIGDMVQHQKPIALAQRVLNMDKVTAIIQQFKKGDRGNVPHLVPAKFVEDTILYAGIAWGLIEQPNDVQLDFDLYALLYRMSEDYPEEWIVWLMNHAGFPVSDMGEK